MYHKNANELPTIWQHTQLTTALDEFGYSYDKNRVEAVFKSNNKAQIKQFEKINPDVQI